MKAIEKLLSLDYEILMELKSDLELKQVGLSDELLEECQWKIVILTRILRSFIH